jgi:hypothetical protein
MEIGVGRGASLSLARCPSIAVDPRPELAVSLPRVDLHQCTSDDFFRYRAARAIGGRSVDLAFIDGMHWAEIALRDFLHLEEYMVPGGFIVIDDVLPNHPVQAVRNRQSRVWTGDVWRVGVLLEEQRPDLSLVWLDAWPAGLLLVRLPATRAEASPVLYDSALRKWNAEGEICPPECILQRTLALNPHRELLVKFVGAH